MFLTLKSLNMAETQFNKRVAARIYSKTEFHAAAPSDIAARLEKLRHKSKNHIFVAEIPFHTGENNTVAGFISFESYETIYCNAGINNPDASVGVVVLIDNMQCHPVCKNEDLAPKCYKRL